MIERIERVGKEPVGVALRMRGGGICVLLQSGRRMMMGVGVVVLGAFVLAVSICFRPSLRSLPEPELALDLLFCLTSDPLPNPLGGRTISPPAAEPSSINSSTSIPPTLTHSALARSLARATILSIRSANFTFSSCRISIFSHSAWIF
jgi:hypothetical protein